MRRSVIIAVVLFLLDAFIFNQGFIAAVVLFLFLPVMIVRALIHRKDKTEMKMRLTVCAVYFIAAILVMTANTVNSIVAESRADRLSDACEDYKNKNNAYPESLSDLVPEFIDEVPLAKYTLGSNRFFYFANKDQHSLSYVSIPPFGRQVYVLEKKKWKFLD